MYDPLRHIVYFESHGRFSDESGRVLSSEVGYLVHEMDAKALRSAAEWVLDTVLPDRAGFRTRCRDLGILEFSLESTVRDYREVFEHAGF